MKTILNLFRLVLAGLFFILAFGCFRKKKDTPNLADWLEKHFPGRYEIVDTWTDDAIRNLSFKVKESVIADRSDSLLQVLVKYDKRDADLGLSPGEIESRFESAKLELSDARSLFAAFQAIGFQKISVGIRHNIAVVLIFEEPSPEHRKQVLPILQKAISSWTAAKKYGLKVAFMEPEFFQTEFMEIIPLKHWVRRDRWQSQKMVVSLNLDAGYVFDLKKMGKAWQFNIESDKLLEMLERARPIAQRWAEERFQRKLFVQPISEDAPLHEKLGARLKFSFAETVAENTRAFCHVEGDYLLDEDVFQNIRLAGEEE